MAAGLPFEGAPIQWRGCDPPTPPCCRSSPNSTAPLLPVRRRHDPRAAREPARVRRGALCAEGVLETCTCCGCCAGPGARRRGVARRDRARARGLPGARRARGPRLHGRPDRRSHARARCRARHPRQRGLGRRARAARAASPGPPRVAAREPGLRTRAQPQDEHGRRVEQARHLARLSRRGAAPRREVPARLDRAAHAHRLGRRLRAPAARLRRDGRPGARTRRRRARDLGRRRARDPRPARRHAARHRRPARSGTTRAGASKSWSAIR